MTLLDTLQRALAELERLHPADVCIHPETCETAKVIAALREALHMPLAANAKPFKWWEDDPDQTSLTTTPEHDKLP